jgi:hypothetical protein
MSVEFKQINENKWHISVKEKTAATVSVVFLAAATTLPEYRDFLAWCALIVATIDLTHMEEMQRHFKM